MGVHKPVWSSSSFLLYLGGLTVLSAALSALGLLQDAYGDAGLVGWSALIFAVLAAIAAGFRRRGEWLAAGAFAFATVVAWGVFAGALFNWWGWLPDTDENAFDGFHVGLLVLELLVLAGAIAALRSFHFPFIVTIAALAAWLFTVDLVSNGGGWSAIVSAFVGVVFLMIGTSYDRGPARPYGFWLHVAAGLAIGGAILYFCHTSDWDFAVVAVAGLLYVALGRRLGRSSWTVLGAIGLLAAATHYTIEWADARFTFFSDEPSSYSQWVPPLVFAFLGFLYVALGLLGRRRDEQVH